MAESPVLLNIYCFFLFVCLFSLSEMDRKCLFDCRAHQHSDCCEKCTDGRITGVAHRRGSGHFVEGWSSYFNSSFSLSVSLYLSVSWCFCVPTGSLSCGGDAAVYVFDINQWSFRTPFILFLCLFLSLWPFQLYCCSLCLWHKPTGLSRCFYSVLVSVSVFMALSTVLLQFMSLT